MEYEPGVWHTLLEAASIPSCGPIGGRSSVFGMPHLQTKHLWKDAVDPYAKLFCANLKQYSVYPSCGICGSRVTFEGPVHSANHFKKLWEAIESNGPRNPVGLKDDFWQTQCVSGRSFRFNHVDLEVQFCEGEPSAGVACDVATGARHLPTAGAITWPGLDTDCAMGFPSPPPNPWAAECHMQAGAYPGQQVPVPPPPHPPPPVSLPISEPPPPGAAEVYTPPPPGPLPPSVTQPPPCVSGNIEQASLNLVQHPPPPPTCIAVPASVKSATGAAISSYTALLLGRNSTACPLAAGVAASQGGMNVYAHDAIARLVLSGISGCARALWLQSYPP